MAEQVSKNVTFIQWRVVLVAMLVSYKGTMYVDSFAGRAGKAAGGMCAVSLSVCCGKL